MGLEASFCFSEPDCLLPDVAERVIVMIKSSGSCMYVGSCCLRSCTVESCHKHDRASGKRFLEPFINNTVRGN